MHYISTRAQAPVLSFAEVVLAGLASDGGLYVPQEIPSLSPSDIAALRGLPYRELAYRIIAPYVGNSLSEEELRRIIGPAYDSFRHAAITPLKQIGTQEWLLELFHGPTLAFKDVALQWLGRLVEHFLEQRGESVVVLGATSGDTGSAAIAGFGGRPRMQNIILFPHGRVSEVQRRQMTTVPDANVHCLAVEGTFDDAQDMVKTLFADAEFRARHRLVAVNSINWARILAQVVYYFYAALQLGAPAQAVSFCVPTGNFGDIFAGYMARQMGLPIHKLIIATNRNDILARCLATGVYGMEGVTPTLSPSMDIQISSNFERLLFDLHDRDGAAIAAMMQRFRAEKRLVLDAPALGRLRAIFSARAVDDDETRATIKDVFAATGELLDPHTAVGVAAGRACHDRPGIPLVTLATAHPAKFPDAVTAACGVHPPLPAHLADLYERPERLQRVANDVAAVKRFVDDAMRR